MKCVAPTAAWPLEAALRACHGSGRARRRGRDGFVAKRRTSERVAAEARRDVPSLSVASLLRSLLVPSRFLAMRVERRNLGAWLGLFLRDNRVRTLFAARTSA